MVNLLQFITAAILFVKVGDRNDVISWVVFGVCTVIFISVIIRFQLDPHPC